MIDETGIMLILNILGSWTFIGAMFSSKQKLIIPRQTTLDYSDGTLDSGGASGVHTDQHKVRMPLDGWTDKYKITVQQITIPSQRVYMMFGVSDEDDLDYKYMVGAQSNPARLLSDSLQNHTPFALHRDRVPMTCIMSEENSGEMVMMEKDVFNEFHGGETVFLHSYFANHSANLTSGSWRIVHQVTFIVGAYRRRKVQNDGERDFKRSEVLVFVAVNTDKDQTPLGWSPPSDGRISNVRMRTMGDEPYLNKIFWMGYGTLGEVSGTGAGETDVDFLPEDFFTLGLRVQIAELSADDHITATSYSREKLFVNKGSPVSIGAQAAQANWDLLIEFDYIPDYQNKFEKVIEFSMVTITDEATNPYIFPIDLYLEKIEIDTLGVESGASVIRGRLYCYIVKSQHMYEAFTTDDPISGLYMKPNYQANDGIVEVGAGELIDVIPITATQNVPFQGTSLEIVNDFYEAGSWLYFHFEDLGSNELDSLDISVNLEGRVALKSNSFGVNILDGNYIIREEEIDIDGAGYI